MPAAAVIPSLIAFSYVVAVKKLVAFISMQIRVTLRKPECSFQGYCCMIQQRITYLSLTKDEPYGILGCIVLDRDR